MDYKIKFRLEKFGRMLVFQVLEMDNRFRCGVKDKEFEYVSSNKLKISSVYNIQLKPIHLQGYGSHVDDVSTCYFLTKEKMNLYYDKVLFAIEDWSKNWKCFKDNKSIHDKVCNEDGIFNFNNKIKFRLDKYKHNLAFQVLKMDERFRYGNCNSGDNTYRAVNGVNVCSIACIGYSPCIICLHGKRYEDDDNLVTIPFDNNKERDENYNKILEALKDWSENWKGFKPKEEIVVKTNGIFTF